MPFEGVVRGCVFLFVLLALCQYNLPTHLWWVCWFPLDDCKKGASLDCVHGVFSCMGKQEQQNRHTTSSSASFPWTGLKRQPSGWFRSALSWFACLWFCSFVACYVTPASDVNLPCLKHDDCSLGLYCIQHVCSTQRPTEQSEEKSAEQPTKDASEPFEDPTGEPLPETSPEVECVPGPVTRACYTGKDGTAGVGMCAFGKERCTAEGKWSGVCEGEIKSQVESCN